MLHRRLLCIVPHREDTILLHIWLDATSGSDETLLSFHSNVRRRASFADAAAGLSSFSWQSESQGFRPAFGTPPSASSKRQAVGLSHWDTGAIALTPAGKWQLSSMTGPQSAKSTYTFVPVDCVRGGKGWQAGDEREGQQDGGKRAHAAACEGPGS